MSLLKNNSKKAQSFLEYSMVIAVIAAVLIAMQVYYSRSLQGHYKETVDRLGSERIGPESFTPGKWFAGTEGHYLKQLSTWGFDYENGVEVSFGIMTGGTHLASQSKISGITVPDVFAQPEIKATLDGGEDKSFFEQTTASSVSPDINIVNARVADGASDWNYGHKTNVNGRETSDPLDQASKQSAEAISAKYVPQEGDPAVFGAENGADSKAPVLEAKNNQYAQNEGYTIP
jgi:hypothetical protein